MTSFWRNKKFKKNKISHYALFAKKINLAYAH